MGGKSNNNSGLSKSMLLTKACMAAMEQTGEQILFLDPDVYFELNEPGGSYECYFYHEDGKGNTRIITVQVLINGAVVIHEGKVDLDSDFEPGAKLETDTRGMLA